MNDIAISVKDFSKNYGTFQAVKKISFDVQRGEIFGLLGPNGSGKTSTLESLEGLRHADGGSMNVLGMDPASHYKQLIHQVGIQLQTSALPSNMTVREAMSFFSAYHHAKPDWGLLERLNLTSKIDAQYGGLSIGQQRRLSLALAITHHPKAVFLDEPTAGLDVASRAELHALMSELRDEGITIILATHDMAEAEKMTDHLAILLNGAIAAQGTPQEITATGSAYTRISVRTENAILSSNGASFPGVNTHTHHEDYDVYFTTNPGASVSAIIQYLDSKQDKLIDLRVERPSLEERFLEITNIQ